MTDRVKYELGVLALVVSFAAGRYSVNAPTIHNVETSKINEDAKTDKDTHKVTTIVSVKEPSGAEKTTTTMTEDIVSVTDDNKISQVHLDQTVTPLKTNTLNISALAGIDFTTEQPVYGASVTKQLIGPITIGVFGLTNRTVGASIGISF